MRAIAIMMAMAVWIAVSGAFISVHAQQPQIPTCQVCNPTEVKGKAYVKIDSRSDATHNGSFKITIEAKCTPPGYPSITTLVIEVNMSDSIAQGQIVCATIDQMTSTGKHSPTVYLNGRCKAENVKGGRFWLMIADNQREGAKGTPDVVGFLVLDGSGKRVAYGTGPVVEGDIIVAPSSY
jgi:hypothetical protein